MKTENLNEIISLLKELTRDINTPQNIKSNAELVSTILSNSKETVETRKNKSIQILEEMVSDINIDIPTRTRLYTILTLMESISKY